MTPLFIIDCFSLTFALIIMADKAEHFNTIFSNNNIVNGMKKTFSEVSQNGH